MNNRFIYWLKIILLLSAIVVVEFFALCAGCILGNSKKFAEILDSNYYDASYSVQIQSLSAVSPADTTSYSFTSSNFPVYISFFNGSSAGTSYDWNDLSLTDYAPIIISFNTSMGLISGMGYFNDTTQNDITQFGFQVTDTNVEYNTWVNLRGITTGNRKYFSFSYNISSLFNFNVQYVNIFTANNFQGRNDSATAFKFYDSNDNVLELQFLFDDTNSQYFEYSNRTYYYLNDFSDNAYYNQGYTSGYIAGENAGSSSGYREGYDIGYNDGYYFGYDVGVDSANEYTFFNLMSAVVEAPVNVFVSMLDFNIMGFNLLDLVLGLLTLAIVVVIVKLCLGGK